MRSKGSHFVVKSWTLTLLRPVLKVMSIDIPSVNLYVGIFSLSNCDQPNFFLNDAEAGEQNETPNAENTFQNTTLVSVSGEEFAPNPVMSYFSYLSSFNF